MEGDILQQNTPKKIEDIDAADLVVGILADLDQETAGTLFEALRIFHGDLRIAILSSGAGLVEAEPDSVGSGKGPRLSVVPWPTTGPDTSGGPMQSISAAYELIFAVGGALGARAGCIIASKLEVVSPQWICKLLQPVLETGFDLAIPNYARRKFAGLLNSSVISPLIRSLYGKRIQNPLGPDLGFSRALFETLGASNGNAQRVHPLASLAPIAICDNLRVCEVHVGPRVFFAGA